MKNTIKIIFAILLIFEFSCTLEDVSKNNIASVKIENFTIQNGTDTILITKEGIQIIVNKNSLKSKDELIHLEFASFIDKTSMVLAKLNTLSKNGEILESDGMINIAVDENVTINNDYPIRIKIPSNSIASGMQIFKGDFKNKQITWAKVGALNQNKDIVNIEKGKNLFLENCTSCHNKNLIDDMTGPALGNIHLFRDSIFLLHFTQNSSKLIASGNVLANCLYSNWNKSVMTSFENLNEDQITQIYNYIESESRNKNIPRNAVTYIDSCNVLFDTTYIYSEGILIDSIVSGQPTNQLEQKVINISKNYEFDINEFGWYNIDLFLNTNNSTIENFSFTIKNKGRGKLFGFAIFKNRNVIISLENSNGIYYLKYGSYKKSIEFPLNEELKIIVFEELNDKIHKIGNIKITSKTKNNSYDIELNEINDNEISKYLNELLQ